MRKLFAQIILLADNNIEFVDRVKYLFSAVLLFPPVAFILDGLNLWFSKNGAFVSFMYFTLIINMAVGAYCHWRKGTFSLKRAIITNGQMAILLTITYTVLEFMRLVAGDGVAGDMFRVTIQIMTLLYPVSKILKNVFIISGGKYPPEWLMKRLYNAEKNGDIKAFFESVPGKSADGDGIFTDPGAGADH